MPISTQRAKKACQAVIKDDSERAELLGRDEIINFLESPFLSEEDSDLYIVDFLKKKVAGELIHCRHHAWLQVQLKYLK